jgi:small subunit ribosomal protein S8
MSSDPIADMLTTIRNATMVYHDKVDVPYSKIKAEIARILKEEGFISNFKKIESPNRNFLRIYLKYGPNKEQVIRSIARVSRPGCRVYAGYEELPRTGDMTVYIVSTPKGIVTDRVARKNKTGGEIVCKVF